MKPFSPLMLLKLLIAGCLWVSVVGCKNTAYGAGKDIEKMGQKIQEKTQ